MRYVVGLVLACALAACPAATARADFHLGFLQWSRQPRPQTVQLQAQMPAAACVPCVPAQFVTVPAAAPVPQPVTVHLQIAPAQPVAVAPAPAPVMLQAAPVAPPPDRYYLLKIDGATGAPSIAPCAPK